MTLQDDFLVEIHTEELPPKSLANLANAFKLQIKDRLEKANLNFNAIQAYATPRRLAVLVTQVQTAQADQVVERKGPALNAAFDAEGKPSKACEGFAKSCGITPAELMTIKNEQGEWLGYKQKLAGKKASELLPDLVEQALLALPIAKRMRWGSSDIQFVRPVHSVILLLGQEVIPATILGCQTGRSTTGHRFHAPAKIDIPQANAYRDILKQQGHVIVDMEERRHMIEEQAHQAVKTHEHAQVLLDNPALLDEVTGLVEWPYALCGQFDAAFLQVPQQALIASMQDHQRYFPVVDEQKKLLPYFITISNIDSQDKARVRHGNERVLRARLSDAAFFFAEDKKTSLFSRLDILKGIVFQAKLGTLYDKTERLAAISSFLADKLQANSEQANRAAWLAKTDLTTQMVGEFPELQGIMGSYYAKHDQEAAEVCQALAEQYQPAFAGDDLPASKTGQILAMADRIDTLVSTFGINQLPTGDKDPYGLRRAALGLLRILIEKNLALDLKETLAFANSLHANALANPQTVEQVLHFLQERLRALYLDKGVSADVFAAVASLGVNNPIDVDQRIHAVQAFKKLNEAAALSAANKRVSNILSKYTDKIEAKTISANLFEHQAEQALAQELESKLEVVTRLQEHGKYDDILLQLAELRKPVDDFFDHVMVMAEDKAKRENRLLLLGQLRALFLKVADIALLQ